MVFWGARGEKYILYEMEGENRLWAFGFGLWEDRPVAEGETWMKLDCNHVFVRSHEKVPEKSGGKGLGFEE
ncbi:MAG: hypothetical protein GX629_04535 [Phycisphaerae bacterium]|nr:hypothetical protein [Phycisphaerae bacterium]